MANCKRTMVNGKARYGIVRQRAVSLGTLATMIPVSNDRKQTRMDHLSRASKLFQLFGCSIVGSTTGHWSAS